VAGDGPGDVVVALGRGRSGQRGHTPETLGEVPQTQRSRRPRWRLVAVFRSGWTVIMAALFNHERLPLDRGHPGPWPVMLRPPSAPRTG
jgi:hypothetical protein